MLYATPLPRFRFGFALLLHVCQTLSKKKKKKRANKGDWKREKKRPGAHFCVSHERNEEDCKYERENNIQEEDFEQ